MKLINLGRNLFNYSAYKHRADIASWFHYIAHKISSLATSNLQQDINIPAIRRPKYPWWVEVKTINPFCIYYFGPFKTVREARLNQDGYIEDLIEERAFGITVELKQCSPNNLTVFAE